jgi:hypothetical protein
MCQRGSPEAGLTAVIIAKTLEFPGLVPNNTCWIRAKALIGFLQNARFEPLSEGLFSSAFGPSLRAHELKELS